MSEDQGALTRIVALGAEVFGAGVGAFVGAELGPAGAAVAAMSGTAIGTAGADIALRYLSPRQEARVGGVIFQAAAAIKAGEVMGQSIRDDGFFDGERSYGHEFAEGVMLVAKDAFEERKIPYLGNLIANVAFVPTIDPATANMAVRMAEDLSWLEMCLLGVIANPEKYPMPDRSPAGSEHWKAHTVRATIKRMPDMGSADLLAYKRTKTEGPLGLAKFDTNLSGIEFTSRGRLIAGLMDLGSIPDADLAAVYDLIVGTEWDAPAKTDEADAE